MRRLLIALSCLFWTTLAFNPAYASQAKPDVVINVKGMVCSFCAQGVEKKLTEIESVARVAISIETKTVEVWLKTAGTLTDEQIKKAINSAGYNIEKIVRGSSRSQKQISGKPDKDPARQAP